MSPIYIISNLDEPYIYNFKDILFAKLSLASIASLLVKLDAVLFKNEVIIYIFLIILLGKCPLQIPNISINILLSSCEVSWVFILVYYILAVYILT